MSLAGLMAVFGKVLMTKSVRKGLVIGVQPFLVANGDKMVIPNYAFEPKDCGYCAYQANV